MLQAETKLGVEVKVGGGWLTINDLVRGLFDDREAVFSWLAAQILWDLKEKALDRVLKGEDELVCTRCGVVHSGGGSLVRRGRR